MDPTHDPPPLRQGCLATLPALLVGVVGTALLWWERSPRALLLYAAWVPTFLLGQGLAGWWRRALPPLGAGAPLRGAEARRWSAALLLSALILFGLCAALSRDLLIPPPYGAIP